MRQHYPKGKQLPALEKNILKYRAFEMVMILFYIEDLKSFVLDSIRATDKINSTLSRKNPRIPDNSKKLYQKVWAVLVSDGIITQEESDDIQRIIDYRNDIAHRIHQLTYDLSRETIAQDYLRFYDLKYDYNALNKLKAYRKKISSGFKSKYIISLSFRSILFEAAKKTYQKELDKLDKKITRQLAKRKKELNILNAELSTIDSKILNEIFPDHPLNFASNGKLTTRGIESCYRLFDLNISTLAVAHLMKLSYRATMNRRKAWEKVGGQHRQKMEYGTSIIY